MGGGGVINREFFESAFLNKLKRLENSIYPESIVQFIIVQKTKLEIFFSPLKDFDNWVSKKQKSRKFSTPNFIFLSETVPIHKPVTSFTG
jgi:hypothetical protein